MRLGLLFVDKMFKNYLCITGLLYYLQTLLQAKLIHIPLLISDEPWRTPCAGSSMSMHELSFEYSSNLHSVLQRIDLKLGKLVIDLDILKRKLTKRKFPDLEFLQTLDIHPRLLGFPEIKDRKKEYIMDFLSERYRQFSIVTAFLEYVPFHEPNKDLRHAGNHLLHDCLEILCEIEIALNSNYVEISSYVSQYVVPREYRHMTRSQRASWSYILIRDILEFVKAMQHHLHIYA